MPSNDPTILREKANELDAKADALMKKANLRCDSAPGSFVTGRSGRTKAANKKTDAALENLVKASVQAGRLKQQAEALRLRAAKIENPPAPKVSPAEERKGERASRKELPPEQALFCAFMGAGFSYCDRRKERNGDYLGVAFVNFRTLAITWRTRVPDLVPLVEADLQSMRQRAPFPLTLGGGQTFNIGCDYDPSH